MAEIDGLLKLMTDRGASDLHIKVGSPPALRLHARLVMVTEMPTLTAEQTHMLAVGHDGRAPAARSSRPAAKSTSPTRSPASAASASTCFASAAASG